MLVTVGLPLWQADSIAWLALESLARQEEAGPWELVVCVERSEGPRLPREIIDYMPRLEKAGLVRLTMNHPAAWMPLATKWQTIAEKASKESVALLLQAADCYAYPRRIADTKSVMSPGCFGRPIVWACSLHGPFCNIRTGTLRLFSLYVHKDYNYPTALNIAIEMQAMRSLPPMDAERGVDGALWNALRRVRGDFLRAALYGSEDRFQGLDTHGYHTISHARGTLIEQCAPPFVETDLDLRDCVPNDVAARLEKMREEVMV